MVRMKSPRRSFGPAKTCSTRARVFDLTIGPRRELSHRSALWHFAVDMADFAVDNQEIFIGLRAIDRISPGRRGRVGRVDQPLTRPHSISPSAAAASVTMRPLGLGFGEFHRSAGIPALLTPLGGLVLPPPRLGDLIGLDRRLIAVVVTLLPTWEPAVRERKWRMAAGGRRA